MYPQLKIYSDRAAIANVALVFAVCEMKTTVGGGRNKKCPIRGAAGINNSLFDPPTQRVLISKQPVRARKLKLTRSLAHSAKFGESAFVLTSLFRVFDDYCDSGSGAAPWETLI
jgi:hypothetical protein